MFNLSTVSDNLNLIDDKQLRVIDNGNIGKSESSATLKFSGKSQGCCKSLTLF